MNLGGNVIFLGQKNQDEVAKYCNKASIFILPSIDIEGFGIVLLEAMACKIPVIATDIVGVASEVIQNNCGIIVKPRDSQALAEAINRLLKNSKSKLLVIGEGEFKNYYSKKASYMNLGGNVIFLGQKNQDEVAKYCNKASIFILPSII